MDLLVYGADLFSRIVSINVVTALRWSTVKKLLGELNIKLLSVLAMLLESILADIFSIFLVCQNFS